jgi:N-acetylglutamate synthase-like GNAT family acetyltransferase
MQGEIREIRSSDKNDILEISRHIWDGHDYLPSVVDEWLKDPRRYFYGVEVAGRIVGVGSMQLIEHGRTGWMEGLRVHPECRGRGYADMLTRYLMKKAEELDIQRLRYATGDGNLPSIKLAKMAGMSRILEMAVLWHSDPEPVPRSDDYPPIRKSTPAQVFELLVTKNIVPLGIFIYDWKALDFTLQNLKEIGKTHKFYVADKKRKADSLSIGCVRREGKHVWSSFTIYAADSSGFLSQLSHDIAVASEHGPSPIACTFETKFDRVLDRVNLGSHEQDRMHLILFEKQIRSWKQPG